MTNSQAETKPRLQQPETVGSLFHRITSSETIFDALNQDAEQGMKFVEVLSKTLNIGEGSPAQRASLATLVAVQMLAERLTPAAFFAKYHIYDTGKMDLRSEWVHAELERRGWSWKWAKDGEDGKQAVFSATRNGETKTASFTIEMAIKKGLVKSSSGWAKDPAQMLRARTITRFATMHDPSIGAGMTEDAEAIGSEIASDSVVRSTVAAEPAPEQRQLPQQAETAKEAVKAPEAETTPQAASQDQQLNRIATSEPAKTVTLHSMCSALDLPARAFSSFNYVSDDCQKITTIGELVKFSYDELLKRDKLGKGTLDKIVVELAKKGFRLRDPGSPSSQSDSSSSPEGIGSDAETAGTETPAEGDAAALAARGLELLQDSDANHTDNVHGAAIADLRAICQDEQLYSYAKMQMKTRFRKDSLHDLSALDAVKLLVCVLANQAGCENKINPAIEAIDGAPVPIDFASNLVKELRAKLGN